MVQLIWKILNIPDNKESNDMHDDIFMHGISNLKLQYDYHCINILAKSERCHRPKNFGNMIT